MPTSTANIVFQFLSTQTALYGKQASALAQTAVIFYAGDLGYLEFAGLVITIVLVIAIVRMAKKLNWPRRHVDRLRHILLQSDISKEQTKRSWSTIERHFFAGDDNDLKIAIIEADKLLENALREAGVMGTSLGERLKKVKSTQLPNVEDVWQAHKLRNQIAHEGDLVLKRDIAERALTIYEEALKSLGALGGK